MSRRLLALLALLAALGAGIAYLLLSPAGLALVWSQARPYLPAGIQVAEVSGRLVGPIRVRGLRLSGDGYRAEVAEAELDWRPLELLGGELVLDYLRADGVRYTARPGAAPPPAASTEAAPPGDWAPPLLVHVRELDLRRLAIQTAPDGRPLTAERLSARAGFGEQGAYVRELRLDSQLLRLRGEANLDPAGAYPVMLRADWTLTLPERPALSGHTRASGDLRGTLRLTTNMAPPLPVRAEARIEQALEQPTWELAVGAEDLHLERLGPDLPPVQGGFQLDARGDRRQAGGRLTLQGRHPELGPFHAGAEADADLTTGVLRLTEAAVTAGHIPGRISARGTIRTGGDSPHLDLSGQWTDLRWPFTGEPRWQSASGRWRLRGTPANLAATLQARINQRGDLDAAVTYRPDALAARLSWQHLAWPDPAMALASPAGDLSLSGAPSDYRYRLDARLSHGEQVSGRITAAGHGDLDGLRLASLRAEALGGTLTGDGELAWRPQLRARLDLAADGLDPGILLPRWPGRLGGQLRITAALPAAGPEVSVADLAVSGRLRQRPVRATGSGRYQPGRLAVEGLTLAVAETTASLSGKVGDRIDLDWRLTSPDLGALHPDAAGSFQGRGHVGGSLDRPVVRTEASGRQLALAGHRIGRLQLAADLDASGATGSRLELAVEQATLAGHSLQDLRLTGSGRPRNHSLELSAVSEHGELAAAVAGDWQAESGRWDFRLQRARLAPERLPEAWRLRAPAAGSVGPGSASLEQACFSAGSPRLCLAGEVGPQRSSGQFRLQALPLGYLLPLLPPDTALEGQINGSGELTWSDGAVTGTAQLATNDGRLLHTRGEGPPQPLLTFGPGTLRLTADRQAVRTEASLNLGGDDRLTVEGRLAQDSPLAEAPISGRLRAKLSNLEVISLLVPEILAIDGRAEADLRLDGQLADPGLAGRLRLTAERVQLNTPGITLRQLRLAAEPGTDGTLELSGSARSGGGQVQLAGSARLAGGERWLQARLSGEEFLAYDTSEARIWLSPELSLALQGRRLEVNGEVRVPRTEITIKELPAKGAVPVSRDQVIVRPEAEGPEQAGAWQLASRVRVILGERVSFQGFGLTSRIAGQLTLVDQPGRPTTASGELRTVEGEYRAYGQRLTIETGKLLFGGGPITDPGIDVRAVRQPRPDILVGVRAYGQLRSPKFEVFSEPAMAQAEQLSWLVLGRPLDATSGGEHAALSRAAVILGMKGGELLADTIGSDLGLDEVSVETQPGATGDQAALVLGKYLSPRLYVSYGVGLFEAVNTLRMQYTLSEHWQLETESSAVQAGGDLVYTIETGK